MIRKLAAVLVCGVITGLLIWAGHVLLFHCFMAYDDEGYVLISLKNFSLHGSLYDRVYSQYGPAFYLYYDALHRLLGFAWTNASGRWITLMNWMGTVALCTFLVYRAQASLPLVCCVLPAGFCCLQIMTSEPMHPGSTVTLIVAATAWLGWEMLQTGRVNSFAAIVAAMSAMLLLVKINVGVFLGLGAFFWLLLSMTPPHKSRWVAVLGALGCLLPIALMRIHLRQEWAQTFALLVASSIMGTVLAAAPAARLQPAKPQTWLWFAGTGLAVTAVISALTLFRGTSLSQLWQGMVVGPLNHPNAYVLRPTWPPATSLLAFGMVGLLLVARSRPAGKRLLLMLAWLRMAATMAWLGHTALSVGPLQGLYAFSYCLPLAGVFAWPLDPEESGRRPADQARAWLALLVVFQSMHAYPVAGSQMNWGVFLWVPLMALGFDDAIDVISRTLSPTIAVAAKVLSTGAICVLSALLMLRIVLMSFVFLTHTNYEQIAQPGAERISLPAPYSSALRILAENARIHGDMLFSLPGTYSFNLWTDIETPTLANATHWFSLLNDEQQKDIITRLDTARRPIVIVQQTVLATIIESGTPPKGPLIEYLNANFHRSFSVEDYSFWVRNDRSITPVSLGTLTRTEGADSEKLRLRLAMAPRAAPIAAVELYAIEGRKQRLITLDERLAEVRLEPIHDDGAAAGSPYTASWPWDVDRLSRVEMTFTPSDLLRSSATIEVVFLNAAGAVVGSARLAPPKNPEQVPQ